LELNAAEPVDEQLDKEMEIGVRKAWWNASYEYRCAIVSVLLHTRIYLHMYSVQAFYQYNLLSIQPGKGVMSFVRAVTEMIARDLFDVDTSGWSSGMVETVVIGIPVVNVIFIGAVLYPYTTSLNTFITFLIMFWVALTTSFVGVEEILSPFIKEDKKKPVLPAVKTLKTYLGIVYGEKTFKKFVRFMIIFIHVFAWFLLAGLVMTL
jgi:hypothetical protein